MSLHILSKDIFIIICKFLFRKLLKKFNPEKLESINSLSCYNLGYTIMKDYLFYFTKEVSKI